MATLTIRNVSERAHDALRRRAAENRRSVEAEVRLLIEAADAPSHAPIDMDRLRKLQAKTIAAFGGADKARAAADEFLVNRAKDWGED